MTNNTTPHLLDHGRSTKWVNISPHDGRDSVEQTGGVFYT